MKITRPEDANRAGDQMPLSQLSSLKIVLHIEFRTADSVTWNTDIVSPGIIKLVSRVQDRSEEVQPTAPRLVFCAAEMC